MGFINALNEAARDSDVYRMFCRGKGFLATVKCQYSFRVGCVADYIAVAAAATAYIHWIEVVVGLVILLIGTGRVYKQTANLLFTSGSIVRYWREELGGKPDKDDPYDLHVPVECFKERAKLNRDLYMDTGLFH